MRTKENSYDFIKKVFDDMLNEIKLGVEDFYGVDNLYLIENFIHKEIIVEEQSRVISYCLKSNYDCQVNIKLIETVDLVKKEFYDPDDRVDIINRIFSRVEEILDNKRICFDKDKIINLVK